jgi:hypothetical protein
VYGFTMRRPSSVTLAGVLAIAGCGRFDFEAHVTDAASLPDAPTYDYCTQVPALAAGAVIDGVLDAGLATTYLTPKWLGTTVPDNVSARIAAAWRADRLYLYVDVTDPDRWPARPADAVFCGDAVELYVDSDGLYPSAPMYDDPGTVQLVVAAPVEDVTPAFRGAVYRKSTSAVPWASSRFGAYPRAGGYTVEAEIVAADLGLASWTLGGQIGFDLAIDVSTPDGSPGNDMPVLCSNGGYRSSQYFLRIAAPSTACVDGGAYCNTAAFCTAALL